MKSLYAKKISITMLRDDKGSCLYFPISEQIACGYSVSPALTLTADDMNRLKHDAAQKITCTGKVTLIYAHCYDSNEFILLEQSEPQPLDDTPLWEQLPSHNDTLTLTSKKGHTQHRTLRDLMQYLIDNFDTALRRLSDGELAACCKDSLPHAAELLRRGLLFSGLEEVRRMTGVNVLYLQAILEVLHSSHRGKQDIYLDMVLEKNKNLNLTAITDAAAAKVRHTEDSLKLLDALDFKNKSIIDVGAGGGFPGVPLAIAEPAAHITLLDATGKKVDFLAGAANKLSLSNTTALHGRAEELGNEPTTRECFDIAVSRGVASLGKLAELCLPLVKIGGVMAAMKSNESEIPDAMDIIVALGGRVSPSFHYSLSDGSAHCIVLIDKISPTPANYPRRYAKITGKP